MAKTKKSTTKKPIALADLSPEDRERLAKEAVAALPIEHVVHAFKTSRTRDAQGAIAERAAADTADSELRRAHRQAELDIEADERARVEAHRNHYHKHGTVTKTPHGVVFHSGCI